MNLAYLELGFDRFMQKLARLKNIATWHRMALFILVGLGVGLLVSAHFWLTARIAGIDFEAKPWPYLAWQFFYELGPQSLTEELFLRGVVFNEL